MATLKKVPHADLVACRVRHRHFFFVFMALLAYSAISRRFMKGTFFMSMKWYQVLGLFTILSTFLWAWGLFAYGKLAATWWGISIWPFAILITAAVVGIAWFFDLLDPEEATPKKFLIFLVVFMLLSAFEGIYINEPMLQQAAQAHQTASEPGQHHGDEHESTFFYYSWWSSATSSSSSSTHSTSSSNSKGAGYVILVLLIIALLLLSAIVPHFWIVSLFVSLVLLWLFSYKEYRRAQRYAYM
jgi:hypothetical protein